MPTNAHRLKIPPNVLEELQQNYAAEKYEVELFNEAQVHGKEHSEHVDTLTFSLSIQ